jgi:hypothetical protein
MTLLILPTVVASQPMILGSFRAPYPAHSAFAFTISNYTTGCGGQLSRLNTASMNSTTGRAHENASVSITACSGGNSGSAVYVEQFGITDLNFTATRNSAVPVIAHWQRYLWINLSTSPATRAIQGFLSSARVTYSMSLICVNGKGGLYPGNTTRTVQFEQGRAGSRSISWTGTNVSRTELQIGMIAGDTYEFRAFIETQISVWASAKTGGTATASVSMGAHGFALLAVTV